MIEHVTDLLGAYQDGELHGLRLRQVEEHLSRCGACRKELAELRHLSSLLQNSVPMEAFTPADKFAANMVLQLSAQDAKMKQPRRAAPAQPQKPMNLLWWLAPVGVLGVWVLAQTVFTVGSYLSAANAAGLLNNITAWLQGGPSQSLWFSASMSLFGGQLSGTSKTVLDVLNDISVTGASLIIQLALQIGIALAYWTWLGLWWRRRRAAPTASLPEMPLHS